MKTKEHYIFPRKRNPLENFLDKRSKILGSNKKLNGLKKNKLSEVWRGSMKFNFSYN